MFITVTNTKIYKRYMQESGLRIAANFIHPPSQAAEYDRIEWVVLGINLILCFETPAITMYMQNIRSVPAKACKFLLRRLLNFKWLLFLVV